MQIIGKIMFWSLMLAIGLLLGIPAAIVQAITGESTDSAANAMSGMEDI